MPRWAIFFYSVTRVYFKIDADASEEKIEELVRIAQKYSLVFNSISKPIPVSVQFDKDCVEVRMLSVKFFRERGD